MVRQGAPEVNDDGDVFGFFDDILGKGLFADFDDKGAVCHVIFVSYS